MDLSKSQPPVAASPYARGTALDAHSYDIDEKIIAQVMDDGLSRVSGLFEIPSALRNTVEFWLRIYVQYSIYHTIIYDKESHHIVTVVDHRKFFDRGSSPIVLELEVKKQLEKEFHSVRLALKNLAQNPKKNFDPASLEMRLQKNFGVLSRKKWIKIAEGLRGQKGQRDKTYRGIQTAVPYLNAMEAIFKKFNVPEELTRLSLVESSFVTEATSKADAVGVWQFLQQTGRKFLTIDLKNGIDERLSPLKSTYAAAKLFQENFRILEDWGLAIIAYNHGLRGLLASKKKYRGLNITMLINNTKTGPLGYASRSYYACFLAALYAEKYRDLLFGISKETSEDRKISIVKISEKSSIYEIGSRYNTSIFELKKYNPDIFNLKGKLPKGTKIVIPANIKESLVKNQNAKRAVASESDDFILNNKP